MAIKLPWNKTPLEKMDVKDIAKIVRTQEGVFRQKDRELRALEQKRKTLLEQSKGANPTQIGLLREQYKNNRTQREFVSREYKKHLGIYRITSQLHGIKKNAEKGQGAADIAKQLSTKLGLNPDKVRDILATHSIDDDVDLEPWADLADEMDQEALGLAAAESESRDDEFDNIVDALKTSPSSSVDALVQEMDTKASSKSKSSLGEL